MDVDIPSGTLGITKLWKTLDDDEFIHCDTVGAANLEFLNRKKHFDVTFEVGQEKKKISCHKSFLMSRSPVFETLFSEEWESSQPILLPNVDATTFKLFLEFVYGDKFTTNIPMAIKLLQLGVKYDVQPLVQKCEQLMSEDIKLDDAIETFTIARRYSLQNLMDQAGEILICHFEALSKGQNFRHFDEETLLYLLKRDEIPLEELKLFNIILRWASDNMGYNSSYSEVLKNIIPLIRFPLMTAQEFATYVFPTQILPQKDVIDLFLYFNSDSTVREDVAKRIQFSSARRKQPITFKLYEPETSAPVSFNASYETLEYRQDHEDNFELRYTNMVSTEATNFKIVELDSLILEGLNYDIVQDSWPPNETPALENNVCVTVEKLGSSGEGTCVFTGNTFVRKGETTNLKVCPRIRLAPDEKHRVKVKYQGNVLVIKQNGQREVDWNYDILTNTKLTPSLSDPNLVGTLEVDMTICKPASEPNSRNNGIYCGPRSLHFLVGLIVIN